MADNWTILEAVATAGGTIVLIGGAVVAGLYGRKANPALAATTFRRPDGLVVLSVLTSVSAPGVRPIRVAKSAKTKKPHRWYPLFGPKEPRKTKKDHAPFVQVLEVLDGDDGPLTYGKEYRGYPKIGGETVGPGETLSKVVLFHQPPVPANLVGWEVGFFVDVRRSLWFLHRRKWWAWAVDTFVPVPEVPAGTATVRVTDS